MNDDKLQQYARQLRNNSTLSEVLLWREIKNKQLGVKFNRQKVIDKYIVDFYCHDLKLIIEIDGASHSEKVSYDEKRQERLISLGFNIIRFLDSDIKKNKNDVIRTIQIYIEENKES